MSNYVNTNFAFQKYSFITSHISWWNISGSFKSL